MEYDVIETMRLTPESFLNRELSALAFNKRVLAQAQDLRVPVLERLRFLCIVGSNLDEFFEIRVGGLKEQIKLKSHAVSTDGRTAKEVHLLVSEAAHALVHEQYELFNFELLPKLVQVSNDYPSFINIDGSSSS